jgi:hypothetical protein
VSINVRRRRLINGKREWWYVHENTEVMNEDIMGGY